MVLPIYTYGQAVLRRPTEEIDETYPELDKLIDDMFETLIKAEGCGLAAPQVGLSIRVFVVDGTELVSEYPECEGFKKEFINPELLEVSDEKCSYSEGCLSLPGISENVTRPSKIKIRYFDKQWQEHIEEYSGFNARIIQHEYDHLDAHVFTDRISPIRRQFIKNRLNNIVKGKVGTKYKVKK